MIRRQQVILTTVEEDFRRIGLLPSLQEADTSTSSTKVFTVSTAKAPAATSSAWDDDDDGDFDPDVDGGANGALKSKPGHKVVQGDKEASLQGEARGYGRTRKEHAGTGYALKTVDARRPKTAKGKRGLPSVGPSRQGLPKFGKIKGGGRVKVPRLEHRGSLGKAAMLIEEVNGILHGVQIDEDVNSLLHGYQLISENAALLADRLIEMTDFFEVDDLVGEMEKLSADAAEAIEVVEDEMEEGSVQGDPHKVDDAEDAEHAQTVAAIKNSTNPPGIGYTNKKNKSKPSVVDVAFKEEAERVFASMITKLMDALEAYDAALDEAQGIDPEQQEDDENEDDDQEEGLLGALAGGAAGMALGGGLTGGAAGAYLGHKVQQAGDAGSENEDDENEDEDDENEDDEGEDQEEGVLGALAGGAAGMALGGGLTGGAAGAYLGHKVQQAGDAGDEKEEGEEDEDEDEDEEPEVHLHQHSHKKHHTHDHHGDELHIHNYGSSAGPDGDDDSDSEGDDDDDDNDKADADNDADNDADDDADRPARKDSNLMAKMHALRSRREEMVDRNGNFRKG